MENAEFLQEFVLNIRDWDQLEWIMTETDEGGKQRRVERSKADTKLFYQAA